MDLSKRMKTVADMVTPGSVVADVGCDHGFVSIYLYEEKIAPKVLAMDVRKGPLERAEEHIRGCGYTSYIETRLSDGVKELLKGEADTLICAGMGGRLMAKILDEGYEKVKIMKELILQPQSDLPFFRKFLRTHQFKIIKESMLKEEGKYYVVIKAAYAQGELTNADAELQKIYDSFGPCLVREKDSVLQEYLGLLLERNQSILARIEEHQDSSRKRIRIQEIIRENKDIETCLQYCRGQF
ncbi:MAG TPA: class I SAM-dependent methyltransferase [Lachnospiraceae bacterium]|nr:class I SAM-dependent methyltransferase [Lachnospiraceae bacterium]